LKISYEVSIKLDGLINALNEADARKKIKTVFYEEHRIELTDEEIINIKVVKE